MYGKPLKPQKTSFTIEDSDLNDGGFTIYLTDLEEPSNDDVRDVDHPDFDILWGNAMENVFEPWDQEWIDNHEERKLKAITTKKMAREWLLSIGMTEKIAEETEY